MTSRLAASLALAAAAAVGLTGCTFITPQSTTNEYSASDGVNVSDAGPVVVRNALVVADAEGTAGNLVAAFINTSASSQTLSVQLEGQQAQTFLIPAGETISLGTPGRDGVAKGLALEGFAGKPGSTVTMFFQSGDELGTLVQVPVLDATLPYYSYLAPSS